MSIAMNCISVQTGQAEQDVPNHTSEMNQTPETDSEPLGIDQTLVKNCHNIAVIMVIH